ncbi:MAG: hypothetical protein F4W89_08875 [Acidobacteria bacterium]|nr:hypothetical protein [Acidobacteriota bacterium]
MTIFGRRPSLGFHLLLLLGIALQPVAGDAAASGTPLIEAVKAEDAAAVEALLEASADANAAAPDGATPLHWAAYRDVVSLSSLLIDAGAAVDAANDYGVTPLALACENGSDAMVAQLLDAGADPNLARMTGETPLMTCARTGRLETVEALLTAGADPNAAEMARGQTALMWAAGQAHADVARALIDAGADVHARSQGGFTPLLIAARVDAPALAGLLVEAGADVNAASPDGVTPLIVATLRGHTDLAIHLLEEGADPNAAATGYTVLHWVSGSWHTELTGDLRGIVTDRDNEWASLNGVGSGRLPLVEALLAHGADPNVRLAEHPPQFGFASQRFRVSLTGATPFLLAAMDARVEVMRALVDAGADTTLATEEGTTPLMVASGLGQVPAETRVREADSIAAVEYLLGLGADVHAVNAIGRSALHGAAHIRSDTLVQMLFDHGAEVNVADVRGITPLMIAEGGGHILLPGLGGGSTADLLRALGSEATDRNSFIDSYRQGPIR